MIELPHAKNTVGMDKDYWYHRMPEHWKYPFMQIIQIFSTQTFGRFYLICRQIDSSFTFFLDLELGPRSELESSEKNYSRNDFICLFTRYYEYNHH